MNCVLSPSGESRISCNRRRHAQNWHSRNEQKGTASHRITSIQNGRGAEGRRLSGPRVDLACNQWLLVGADVSA